MQQEIIRATAKFQEAAEPARLRPCIIQVEEVAETRANQQQLPNTVRSSMDSQGRDNPFRPDGEIYKSADPIVECYKHGHNQSRAQSPADALLSSGLADEKKKKLDNNKRNKKTKVAKGENNSCWRRWLGCRCWCCCKSKRTAIEEDAESIVISKQTKLVVVDQTNTALEGPLHDHHHQKEQPQKKQQVSTTKAKLKTIATTLGKSTQ